jgi:parvulin-like peptidyl-prolyl isomerase
VRLVRARSLFIALAAIAAFSAAPSLTARAAVVDKIVVVVNNEVITQGEIDRMLAPVYQHFKSVYQGPDLMAKLDEARQKIMGQLIEEKLLLGEAKKLNIEVEEKDIAARMSDAQKRFASRELFERALAEQRMTPKDLKAKFRDQLMTRKLVDQKVGSRIIITPVEVSEYYRSHASDFTQSDEIMPRNILIKPGNDLPPDKALELAEMIGRRLKDGADFAELARTYSSGPGAADGGVMGYRKRGELMPEIEDVIFSLKEGETSDMIRTGMGYFFFKIEEKRPGRKLSLAEARAMIEEVLYSEKGREKMKGWMEGLKKNAYIAFR